jgi:hypothetical protein
VALLRQIREMRGTASTTIEEFLDELGLKPFQTMTCDAYPFEVGEEILLRTNFIMYNNRNDTVTYNITNSEGRILNSIELILPPHSFLLIEADLRPDRTIQILDKDSCQKVYYRTKQDYLIIN